MDNLEYFNGGIPPSILADVSKIVDKGHDTLKRNNSQSIEEAQNGKTKHLPMPPSNTNFKAISAAALVASRRQVTSYKS